MVIFIIIWATTAFVDTFKSGDCFGESSRYPNKSVLLKQWDWMQRGKGEQDDDGYKLDCDLAAHNKYLLKRQYTACNDLLHVHCLCHLKCRRVLIESNIRGFGFDYPTGIWELFWIFLRCSFGINLYLIFRQQLRISRRKLIN